MAAKHAGSGTGRVGRRRMLVVAAVALAGVASGTLFANAGSDLASAGSKASKIGHLSPLGCFDDKDALTDTCSKHTLGLGAATALAISPDGRSIYVVSEGQTLVRAKRDPSTGKLSPRGCIEETGSAIGCADHADGLGHAGAVTVSPDGRSVYVASEFGGISRFKRDRGSGKLTPKGCIEDDDTGTGECSSATSGLDGATSVVVSRDGRSVYVSAESDSTVVRFKRDRGSGKLTPKGCIARYRPHRLRTACSRTQQSWGAGDLTGRQVALRECRGGLDWFGSNATAAAAS